MLETSFSGVFTTVDQDDLSGLSNSSFSAPVTRVLVVDSDEKVRVDTAEFLAGHGFLVSQADNATTAQEILVRQGADIVILDVLIPGGDGLSIARELSMRTDLGVIIVSKLSSEIDRIVGLEAGADDYLAKPVSLRELLARIRAVRRRTAQSDHAEGEGASHYTFCGWSFDAEARILYDPQGKSLNLSEGEFSLLRTFVQRPQRVLTRDQLLEYARGQNSDAYDRAIDTLISRLRRKLRSRTSDELIRTIRAEGYMFVPRVAHR